jgi:hypothetical protein
VGRLLLMVANEHYLYGITKSAVVHSLIAIVGPLQTQVWDGYGTCLQCCQLV